MDKFDIGDTVLFFYDPFRYFGGRKIKSFISDVHDFRGYNHGTFYSTSETIIDNNLLESCELHTTRLVLIEKTLRVFKQDKQYDPTQF